MQGIEEDRSNLEQKQVEEVHKCITSTRTGNCAAANNSSALVSEEGEKKKKKRNRRQKNKSKANDSENGNGNCAAVNNSSAHVSEERETKKKKKNGKRKNKSKAKDSENRTGNCAAVNNSSAHVSEKGETKEKKKNGKRKKKSKAKDSENGTGNCAAVNNSSAHVSEEGETKKRKKNRKRKNKSKAKHSENGDILEEIRVRGELKAETMAILLENGIEFSPYDVELHQYLPRSPFKIPEDEIKSRSDLRDECIFTVDPPTARNLDDALSCKELDNGNLMIGVHITDVSYFLKEGTPLDEAVAKKATSTYLVKSVLNMLPIEMCKICSLSPGDDKLAFSVFWEMTPEAEIVNHFFDRSVIKSCVQLTSEHAQIMLENPDKEWNKDDLPQIYGKYTAIDLSRVVNNLNRIAVIMRNKRLKDGAIRMYPPKLTFSVEKRTGLPSAYSVSFNKECNRLIEEFMVLANMTVAKRLASDFPGLAFLRCQPSPHKYVMEKLQKSLEQRGIFLDIQSAGGLQAAMWHYAGDDDVSQARMMVLNNLCAKLMSKARYSSPKFKDNVGSSHNSVNVPLYTQFTSPMRRYADVMVHRFLCVSLGYSPKPDWKPSYLRSIADKCKKKQYQARRADEQSTELYFTVYIGLHGPIVEKAVVMDVKDLSFDVIVLSTGKVQKIYTDDLPLQANVTCRKENYKIIAQEIEWLPTDDTPFRTLQIVEVFSIVTVELSRCPQSLKVKTRLLRP